MDEAAPGVGRLCGSSFLDRRFDNWLTQKFIGYHKWTDDYHADALQRWESEIKRDFTGDPRDTYTLPARGLPNSTSRSIHSGVLEMTLAEVKAIFDPIVTEIVELVQDQITAARNRTRKDIKAVLLAGGFGSNVYLRKRIQEAIGDKIEVKKMKDKWVQPSTRNGSEQADMMCSTTAIVQGALIRGLADHSPQLSPNVPRPTVVRTRFASSHIGTIALEKYDPAIHGVGRPTYVETFYTKFTRDQDQTMLIQLAESLVAVRVAGGSR